LHVAGDTFEENLFHLYDFPSLDKIATADEEDLRTLGMGYRAKYLKGSAMKIIELGGQQWLTDLELIGHSHSLEKEDSNADVNDIPSRKLVQQQLMGLPGVGPKVL
jgi:3-methyladenine DNA glycosylase/8-oxoguanine DNA glycosylase